jgi:hypothetical protein
MRLPRGRPARRSCGAWRQRAARPQQRNGSRTGPKDLRVRASCHEGDPGTALNEKPMYDGINMAGVARLRKATKLKLFIKGIDTREDARMALEHGGRSTETPRPTIQAQPEVATEAGGRIPVFVDGGVRRGTDVFHGRVFAVGTGPSRFLIRRLRRRRLPCRAGNRPRRRVLACPRAARRCGGPGPRGRPTGPLLPGSVRLD